MNGQMRWQTSGGREGRWWHQTHSNMGINISGLLKFYFTGIDFHILRVNNYTGIMQRAYLRTRTHQSRASCHWVTRRNWGSCLYAGTTDHIQPDTKDVHSHKYQGGECTGVTRWLKVCDLLVSFVWIWHIAILWE